MMGLYHHGHGFLEDMLDSNIAFGFNDVDDQNALLATPTTVLESSHLSITSSSFDDFSLPFIFDPQTLNCSSFGQHDSINPYVDHHLLSPHHTDPNIKLETSPLYDQDYYSMFSMLDDVQNCHFVSNLEMSYPQVVTGEPESERPIGFNMGKNGKNGKVEGHPSKNLMAERRRRKRLNDRLSMLRSVVPKISKMDRTSILADTIDYMKELIEKIKHMQQQMEIDMDMDILDISSTTKPKEIFIRNSPKFEVERRNADIRVSVCCSGNPELLMSTLSTLEALGLQIHQCVISCFNDFTMHASCHEEMEQRLILNTDDIKQALYRNAGYGGKCL